MEIIADLLKERWVQIGLVIGFAFACGKVRDWWTGDYGGH